MKSLKKRWRKFEVRLQKNERIQGALKRVFASYIDFVFRTTKWEKIGFESYEADIARGIPRVLCCWHERLALTPYLRDWKDHPLTVLASKHADAQIATASMEMRGIKVISLATSGNNGVAIREAVRALRDGSSLGVTIDGPLGPARVGKPGALLIAGMAKCQAAPCTFAVSRSIRLSTWDKFIVPLPWSKGVMAVGDGFTPDHKAGPEQSAADLERLGQLIDQLTEECESRLTSARK